jgi:YrbI family 3-deoxy-D-manno-octulosonate 8-phosphate phosphatase
MKLDDAIIERARRITLLLSDVDGVLNDGRLTFDEQGGELKQFHIRDGLGVKLWQRAGHRFGIVTGRSSPSTQRRAAELGVSLVRQGAEDKLAAVQQIIGELKISPEAIAYIGDDLPDLPAIRFVGLGVAVCDACDVVRSSAAAVTKTAGGYGAVRELIEAVLAAQGRWDEVISSYAD